MGRQRAGRYNRASSMGPIGSGRCQNPQVGGARRVEDGPSQPCRSVLSLGIFLGHFPWALSLGTFLGNFPWALSLAVSFPFTASGRMRPPASLAHWAEPGGLGSELVSGPWVGGKPAARSRASPLEGSARIPGLPRAQRVRVPHVRPAPALALRSTSRIARWRTWMAH